MSASNLLVARHTKKTIQAHLANGHMGLQGTDSGLAPARSFMQGISDLMPADFYKMANLPTWNTVEIEAVGGETLSAAFERGAEDYQQTVDTSDGSLTTHYRVHLSGADLHVHVLTLLSMANRFLAYQKITLEASAKLPVTIRFGITQNEPPARYPFRSICWPHSDYPREYGQGFQDKRMAYAWRPGHTDVTDVQADAANGVWAASATAAGHGPAVGVGIAVRAELPPALGEGRGGASRRLRDASDGQNARGVLTVDLPAGAPFCFEQFIGFSRDAAAGKLAEIAAAIAEAARDAGAERLLDESRRAWADLWRGDIQIEGDDSLARQARADLYYLYANAPADERYPFQIMGIASPGYFGGCFWDCDVYMVPASLPFIPERAINNVRFRKRILPQAMRNAREEGHPGARYSLISELVEGEENCLGHSAMAKGEIHFTADAAISAWMCYCATGDLTFLRVDAWPVIRAVAEYFASRVSWIPWENRYELLHVHSAEEALGDVHNCLFTNSAVRKAMRVATRTAELIGTGADPVWAQIAGKLHSPINPKTGQYQAHSATDDPCGNRFLEVGAVVIADLEVTPGQLEDIISVPPITWDMSLQATVAAQAGNPVKMREYLDHQATHFVHQDEFLLRTEMKENDAGPYLCGSGSFLVNLVQGAGGLRWTEEGLTPRFAPCLPDGITRITLPRLMWHGRAHAVTIDPRGLSIEKLKEQISGVSSDQS